MAANREDRDFFSFKQNGTEQDWYRQVKELGALAFGIDFDYYSRSVTGLIVTWEFRLGGASGTLVRTVTKNYTRGRPDPTEYNVSVS